MAVNICERVEELNTEPQLKPYITLPQMAVVAQLMLKDSLNAFVNEDPELARKVIQDDAKVDAYLDQGVSRAAGAYDEGFYHNVPRHPSSFHLKVPGAYCGPRGEYRRAGNFHG
ncbi:MAG: hypothetical protein MZU95_02975 [Desulfomicrobium escambiense]|nr:hypothetical protein [Desulfomicrobium escambiense]